MRSVFEPPLYSDPHCVLLSARMSQTLESRVLDEFENHENGNLLNKGALGIQRSPFNQIQFNGSNPIHQIQLNGSNLIHQIQLNGSNPIRMNGSNQIHAGISLPIVNESDHNNRGNYTDKDF